MSQPLEFALVYYDPYDPLSYFSALLTFWPFVIGLLTFAAFVTHGELWMCVVGSGQLANELLNHVLKHAFAGQRPDGSAKQDFGFPSSHAQWVGFSLVLARYTFGRLHRPTFVQHIALFLFSGLCIATPVSRVYLGVHSYDQVAWGAAIGAMVGVMWVWIAKQEISRMILDLLSGLPGVGFSWRLCRD